MKIKRIRAGEYTFTNDHGFSGMILSQPEGGWTVFEPKSYTNLEFFMHYSSARNFASKIDIEPRNNK